MIMLRGRFQSHKNRLRGPSYSAHDDAASAHSSTSIAKTKRRDHAQGHHLTRKKSCIWTHISEETENQFLTWPLISYLALANLKSSLHVLEWMSPMLIFPGQTQVRKKG